MLHSSQSIALFRRMLTSKVKHIADVMQVLICVEVRAPRTSLLSHKLLLLLCNETICNTHEICFVRLKWMMGFCLSASAVTAPPATEMVCFDF